MNRPNLEDYKVADIYTLNTKYALADYIVDLHKYCDYLEAENNKLSSYSVDLENQVDDLKFDVRDAQMSYLECKDYADKLKKILHKMIEDKVASELLDMRCNVTPEYFDELVEKRFNKLIQESDNEENS